MHIVLETEDLDEKKCDCCESMPVLLSVVGDIGCYYCNNKITLCKSCFLKLKTEIKEFGE